MNIKPHINKYKLVPHLGFGGLGGGNISRVTFLNWPMNFAIAEKKSSESVLGSSPNLT